MAKQATGAQRLWAWLSPNYAVNDEGYIVHQNGYGATVDPTDYASWDDLNGWQRFFCR